MDAKTEIMRLLSDGIERRSITILLEMKKRGMWFAELRVYPALRKLEESELVYVSRRYGTESAMRGGRASFWYGSLQ